MSLEHYALAVAAIAAAHLAVRAGIAERSAITAICLPLKMAKKISPCDLAFVIELAAAGPAQRRAVVG